MVLSNLPLRGFFSETAHTGKRTVYEEERTAKPNCVPTTQETCACIPSELYTAPPRVLPTTVGRRRNILYLDWGKVRQLSRHLYQIPLIVSILLCIVNKKCELCYIRRIIIRYAKN